MPVSQCYVSLWLVIIETDGTYVSFWAEKPPNMLRLQFDSVLGFNFLVALADVEIIGYPRVEWGGWKRFLPECFERGWERSVLSSGKRNDIDVAGREGVCSCRFFFCSTGSSACCRLNTSCCSLLPLSSALQRLSWQRYGGEAQRCRVEGHPQHVHKRYGEGSQG